MSILKNLFGPPNMKQLIAERDFDGLVKALAYKKDDKIRAWAADALGKIGDARPIAPLTKALFDTEWTVRKSAAEALGRIIDPRSAIALIGAFRDPNLVVRSTVISSLVKIGTWAVEPLTMALELNEMSIFWGASEALGEIGDPHPVDALIGALNRKSHFDRAFAADALGKIGDQRAVEPLIDTLKDANFGVRDSAAKALVKIGIPAVEPLTVAIKGGDKDVRKAAAEVLRKIEAIGVP